MLNLVSSRLPGAGLRSGIRVPGTRWLVLVCLGSILSGCATKGDLRSVQDEIRALGAQQRQDLEELSGLNMAVQDTLRGQSDALFESRGDINRRLREIQQEILTLQELFQMNQQALARIENLLLSQPSGGMPPTRTDTDPGQSLDVEARAGGPVELYNAAVVQYNNGSLNTARLAFQRFLTEYPYDDLADDALYYLADILVQEERPEEAIAAFLRVRELHPNRERVPDALFRVGLIYIQLDQLDDARSYLRMVVNTYSDSGAAALARQKLAEIG